MSVNSTRLFGMAFSTRPRNLCSSTRGSPAPSVRVATRSGLGDERGRLDRARVCTGKNRRLSLPASRYPERRVQVLTTYGLIDAAAGGRFNTIRETRRGYLHLWSQDHDSLPRDAIKGYHAAVALVATVIGQDFTEGKIIVNPRLVGYLERKGVYHPREERAV
jgi:hypothetical protein